MKPGKPVSMSIRDDKKTWIGLPGNPLSALVTCLIFVLEYLGRGLEFEPRPIESDLRKNPGRDEYVPASLTVGGVRLFPTIGSHATLSLLSAPGLALIPGEKSLLRSGDHVSYAVLPWRLS